MVALNKQLKQINPETGFSAAARYVAQYRAEHPKASIVSLGIGDVSRPVIKPVLNAMHTAVDDLGSMDTFQGYGAYYGIDELREAILQHEYAQFGFTKDEIYVSDGTKPDATNLLELFDARCKILLPEICYPIYRNGAYAMGRKVYTAPVDKNFVMRVPKEHFDIVYICSPSNPTGLAYTRKDLKKWLAYCKREEAVLIFDNVYESFISSEDVPHSIYEIPGAESCAIELRSFSKKASFTGLRCSYFVLPRAIDGGLFKERTINRFNGASYVAQKGALACFRKDALRLIQKNVQAYKDNAAFLKHGFQDLGFQVAGGEDAPFLWVAIPGNTDSFAYFKMLLEEIGVVVVPGIVFGKAGDGFFRVSGFGSAKTTKEAMKRIANYYANQA